MSVSHTRAAQRAWYPFDVDGIEFSPLHANPDGRVTVLTRFRAGTHGSWHSHPGGEELYVIRGRAVIAGVEVDTGDFLYTPPGAVHTLHALTDVEVLLVLPQQPIYDEAAAV